MSCGKDRMELLDEYLEAQHRLDAAMPKAQAAVPGQPLRVEWMDERRIALIDELEKQRNDAQRAWREHWGRRQAVAAAPPARRPQHLVHNAAAER